MLGIGIPELLARYNRNLCMVQDEVCKLISEDEILGPIHVYGALNNHIMVLVVICRLLLLLFLHFQGDITAAVSVSYT